MKRLKFYWERLRANEASLSEYSDTLDDLATEVRGKSVALVGNARSMLEKEYGGRIEGADVVIRINSAPNSCQKSHGRRTDWHALAVRNTRALRCRVNPERVLWMSHKRRRLDWATAQADGFYLFPVWDFHKLSAELETRPSTGVLLIDLLRRLPASQVELFGFDFFASLSLTGSRTAGQVPHDFDAERYWVEDLIAKDQRFKLITS